MGVPTWQEVKTDIRVWDLLYSSYLEDSMVLKCPGENKNSSMEVAAWCYTM
jgi:hypothetical protein